MSAEIGKAATRIALFIIVAAIVTLLWVHPGIAEFVVLILTLAIGLLMLGVVAVLARTGSAPWSGRRLPPPDDGEPPAPPEE